jgi:hypothetical protein
MRMIAFGLSTDSADAVCRIGGRLQIGLPGVSGQKKRATLSDHPIAIARSCEKYRPFGPENQALF